MSSLEVENHGREEGLETWTGVVGTDTSEQRRLTQSPWEGMQGLQSMPNLQCDIDDDHTFLTSLFDDILDESDTVLGLELDTREKPDGLEYFQAEDLVSYMSNNEFRTMIRDCSIDGTLLDSDGIRDLTERTMRQVNRDDIDSAKAVMRHTLQSCSGPGFKIPDTCLQQQQKTATDNLCHTEKALSLLVAPSPSILDKLHRPSTSTEHVPLDVSMEALFHSPLTDLCELKLTLSPHTHLLQPLDFPPPVGLRGSRTSRMDGAT